MTRECTVPRRPGTVGRIVSAQAAHPHGLLGRAMGRLWVSETAAVNDRAVTLLDPRLDQHILEIGFGPGRTVHEIAARGARVTGVEVSAAMLTHARRRNRAAVRAEQVRLLLGDVGALPADLGPVDAALAVHTVYFWPDLTGGLRELHRVLVPGGQIVLAFRGAEHGLPRRFDPAVYRVPTTDQVRQALTAVGFGAIIAEHDRHGTAHLTARVPGAPASTDREADRTGVPRPRVTGLGITGGDAGCLASGGRRTGRPPRPTPGRGRW